MLKCSTQRPCLANYKQKVNIFLRSPVLIQSLPIELFLLSSPTSLRKKRKISCETFVHITVVYFSTFRALSHCDNAGENDKLPSTDVLLKLRAVFDNTDHHIQLQRREHLTGSKGAAQLVNSSVYVNDESSLHTTVCHIVQQDSSLCFLYGFPLGNLIPKTLNKLGRWY